jgi:acetyl esterase/lipase
MCKACYAAGPVMAHEQHPGGPNMQNPQNKASLRTPIHHSVLDKLDPEFIKIYNSHIANGPAQSTDINVVRANYSSIYAFATAPPSGVGGIGETQVPGWEKYPGDIDVRVYVPPGEEPGERKVWPVHFNFHGGGEGLADKLQAVILT